MYPLTPFRYLVEGFVGTVVHGVPVVCDESEFARFPPPPGQTCQQYTRDFIQRSGGYVEDRDGMCRFCQFSSGDEFVSAPSRDLDELGLTKRARVRPSTSSTGTGGGTLASSSDTASSTLPSSSSARGYSWAA